MSKEIQKGSRVKYKRRVYTVRDIYFTCPCAVGDKRHHPKADVTMLVLSNGKEVPDYDVTLVRQ